MHDATSPFISVIVPVYNVKPWLQRCVNSILKQSFYNFELILVDDGSTDGSAQLCDELQLSDSRIIVIHRENGGLSAARNSGLNIMRGTHVAFIDSDDAVHPDYLSSLVSLIYKESSAIACIGFEKVYDGDRLPENPVQGKIISMKPVEAVKKALYQQVVDNSAWGKLYPSELWNNLRYREGIGYEDIDSFYILFLKASRIIVSTRKLYFYTVRHTSYLGHFSIRRADVLDVTDRMINYMENNHPELLPAAKCRAFGAACNILGLLDTYTEYSCPEITSGCISRIKELRYCVFFNPQARLQNRIAAAIASLSIKLLRFALRIFYKN